MTVARQDAYCSLLTSDEYLPGAMVLAHSLRDAGTKKRLAILVTFDSLSASTIDELKQVYDQIVPVDRIVNKSPANLFLMNRPDLSSTFTKIALWRQTQFRHIVYIDADIVALRAPDELFKDPPSFAAAPDVGWPDCFNSGVLSLRPNMGDFYGLLALANRGISFDGADQGLLNMHFRNWERLSFTYNCTPSGSYQYAPAYKHFQSSISMLHFIGNDKPWVIGREYKGFIGVYEELLARWWAVYDKHYRIPKSTVFSIPEPEDKKTIQQHVAEGNASSSFGHSFSAVKLEEPKQPEAPVHITEPSLSDKAEPAEEMDKGGVEPKPTAEARRYSVDWDPRYQAPPTNSRPEAANFPHEHYSMSSDLQLFQAPKIPEPPIGMHFEVPKTTPASEPPKPIFPWEKTAPKPTRVFPEDFPAQTMPLPISPSVAIQNNTKRPHESSPSENTVSLTSPNFPRTNAWDEVPEIERYVASLSQNRRSKAQVIPNKFSTTTSLSNPEPILSPTTIGGPVQPRRPSLKLTDFPTEVERPSLPVTPAPVRRPSFWGAERDEQGELPGAEGVPPQNEWDPVAKLQDLAHKQSEMLASGPRGSEASRAIPDRQLPGSASVPMSDAKDEDEMTEGTSLPTKPDPEMPSSFQTVDFNRGHDAKTDEQQGKTADVEILQEGSIES